MRTVTIRDVAKHAGVGLGTVSRVINDSPQVSMETRQRVLNTIEDLNFIPNPTARRLSLGKTLVIAVIVPFFTRPSVIERLRGVSYSLAESEYDLTIYNVETVKRRDECIRKIPRREYADGVLIFSLSPRDEDIPYLQKADVPVVLVDANHPSLTSLNRLIVDDAKGGEMATKYLIKLGHKKIGYISDLLDNPFNFTSSRERYKGYRQALQSAGIPFKPHLHLQAVHGRFEARRLASQMLSSSDPPTAIFASSDTQALGVLETARQLGIRVPDDLSVIGYDDIEISEYLGLTTVRQMLYESGQRGVEILLDTLENPQIEPLTEVQEIDLIIRNTTAPV